MEAVITDLLTPEHDNAKLDMINAICSDPCIPRFDYEKRPYLLTDFSKKGFGWIILQPDSDHPASMEAMRREMSGGDCEFLLPKSTPRLWSTGFGLQTTQGRDSCLHFHLGEAFALDWAIHKNRAKLWGICFTVLTDYMALRFILTYNGWNPVLLRLQIRFQLWAMDLYHRPGDLIIIPDYFSRYIANLCFDDLARNYLNRTVNFCQFYPASSGTMLPENMPGYRAYRIRSPMQTKPAVDAAIRASTPIFVIFQMSCTANLMLHNPSLRCK